LVLEQKVKFYLAFFFYSFLGNSFYGFFFVLQILFFSDDLGFSCEGMLFDTNILELRNYISNKSHFDCYFKVKKDSYSNDTVIHLEDIH